MVQIGMLNPVALAGLAALGVKVIIPPSPAGACEKSMNADACAEESDNPDAKTTIEPSNNNLFTDIASFQFSR